MKCSVLTKIVHVQMNLILTRDRNYNKGVINYNTSVYWNKEED